MEPIEGGQSGTAPPCVPSATASATSSTDGEVAKETRGVESRGDLVIQVSITEASVEWDSLSFCNSRHNADRLCSVVC